MINTDLTSQKSRDFLAWISCFLTVLFLAATSLHAHELWLEPLDLHIDAGEPVQANIIIGERLLGNTQIYMPVTTEKLLALTKDGQMNWTPRVGSRPAIDIVPEQTGHVVLVYQSSENFVKYRTLEKFLKFATKKGAENIAEQHRERALPLADFSEIYRRYAKASLFIGDHTDEVNDSNVGMEVEFVITSASKVENGSQRLRVRLLYQGQALGNAMITLFSRDATGKVEKTIDKTSPDGTITVTAEAGYFYLLDHVVIRATDPATNKKEAPWESLWASLTFSGPQQITK
jgi:uncharacterized GH25 family protein